jgi:hypothetical protein
MGNMSKQKRLKTRYAWIEASLRYTGKFDKVSYGSHFLINPPQISADQTEFVAAVNNELRMRERGSIEGHGPYLTILKGKIELEQPLPERPLFDVPELREWLATTVTIPFIQVQDYVKVDPDPEVTQAICMAIMRKRPMRALIAQDQEALWRNISPHALVEAAGQIHVRCYIHEAEGYHDIKLTRVVKTGPHDRGIRYMGGEADEDWRTAYNLVVHANPEAGTENARNSIREYALCYKNLSRTISVPRALMRFITPETLGAPCNSLAPIVIREAS